MRYDDALFYVDVVLVRVGEDVGRKPAKRQKDRMDDGTGANNGWGQETVGRVG